MTGRLRNIQVTTRGLVAAIAVAAPLVWCGVAAWRVPAAGDRWISHRWESVDGQPGVDPFITTYCRTPFWPQFKRTVLGMSWPGDYACEDHEVGQIREIGQDARHFRLVSTTAVPPEQTWGVRATLESVKTISPNLPPQVPSGAANGPRESSGPGP